MRAVKNSSVCRAAAAPLCSTSCGMTIDTPGAKTNASSSILLLPRYDRRGDAGVGVGAANALACLLVERGAHRARRRAVLAGAVVVIAAGSGREAHRQRKQHAPP